MHYAVHPLWRTPVLGIKAPAGYDIPKMFVSWDLLPPKPSKKLVNLIPNHKPTLTLTHVKLISLASFYFYLLVAGVKCPRGKCPQGNVYGIPRRQRPVIWRVDGFSDS